MIRVVGLVLEMGHMSTACGVDIPVTMVQGAPDAFRDPQKHFDFLTNQKTNINVIAINV